MKNIILTFFLFAGLSFTASAVKYIDPRDTFHLKKADYKLSKKEFMDKYGKDDSAKALIKVFFSDRSLGYVILPIYPVFIGVNAILNKPSGAQQVFASTQPLAGGVAGLASLTGVYFLTSTTRKDLLKELKYYQVTGHLSDDYRIRVRQKLFRMNKKANKVCPIPPPPANGGKAPSSK